MATIEASPERELADAGKAFTDRPDEELHATPDVRNTRHVQILDIGTAVKDGKDIVGRITIHFLRDELVGQR